MIKFANSWWNRISLSSTITIQIDFLYSNKLDVPKLSSKLSSFEISSLKLPRLQDQTQRARKKHIIRIYIQFKEGIKPNELRINILGNQKKGKETTLVPCRERIQLSMLEKEAHLGKKTPYVQLKLLTRNWNVPFNCT